MLGATAFTCAPGAVRWIETVFEDCLYDATDWISFAIGLTSICFWIVAQFPQLIKNFRLGKAEALSWIFLLEWWLGDITNLAGAILAGQLSTQIITAVYFVVIDLVMGSQWVYYTYMKKRFSKYAPLDDPVLVGDPVLLDEAVFSSSNSQPQLSYQSAESTTLEGNSIGYPKLFMASVFLILNGCILSAITVSALDESHNIPLDGNSRMLLSTSSGTSSVTASSSSSMSSSTVMLWSSTVGIVLGWVSALFYLGSRIPQIIRNLRRHSVEGLSLAMFCCAFMGNLTYALAIFARSQNPSFLIAKLPWLVGSIGTFGFDFIVCF